MTGLKFVPRYGWGERANNCKIEVSDYSNFGQSKTVIATIPTTENATFGVIDLPVDTPCEGRYLRIVNAQTLWNLAEVEAIGDVTEPVQQTFASFGLVNGQLIFTGSNMGSITPEVERWNEATQQWETESFRTLGTYGGVAHYAFGATAPTLAPGRTDIAAATYRVRATDADEWTTVTNAATRVLSGTVLYKSGDSATFAKNAFDTNPFSFYEPQNISYTTAYVGLDLGALRRIDHFEVVPRANNLGYRLSGCQIEVANKADFSDATVVATVPTVGTYEFRSIVLPLETPVFARYVRMTRGTQTGSETWNVAEISVFAPPASNKRGLLLVFR